MLKEKSESYLSLCLYMIDSQIKSLEYHNTINKEIDPKNNNLIKQEFKTVTRVYELKIQRGKLIDLMERVKEIK